MTNAAGHSLALVLFVVGDDPTSRAQITAFRTLLRENDHPPDALTIVDLSKEPGAAVDYDILAIPTLLRTEPEPLLRIIGEMGDRDRVWKMVRD